MLGNDDVLELLEQKRKEAEEQLARITTAIAALRNGAGIIPQEGDVHPSRGVIPPIVDIIHYLKQAGRPVHQNEIIRTVGALRQKRYPGLTTHYSNVWRALEYHIRHNQMICCVDQYGIQEVPLKTLPKRSKTHRLSNVPELYEAENWFWLKEEMAEGRHFKSERALGEAGQD